MLAAVLCKPHEIRLKELPMPQHNDSQILMKIGWTGICGSDVEAYKGHRPAEFFAEGPQLGHEASGTIEKLGPKSEDKKTDIKIMNI